MKRYFLAILILASLFALPYSYAERVDLYVFHGKTCPHCKEELNFLNSIIADYPELVIHDYEVFYSNENAQLFSNMAEAYDTVPSGVPMTFIGDRYLVGYQSADSTGAMITGMIESCIDSYCEDPGQRIGIEHDTKEDIEKIKASALEAAKQSSIVSRFVSENPSFEENVAVGNEAVVTFRSSQRSIVVHVDRDSYDIIKVLQQGAGARARHNHTEGDSCNRTMIDVPMLGEIDIDSVGIPLFTLIIAGLDGFNPCAMWVLTFLLTLLIHARSRKKMLIIGGIFIFTSALVYFLFMTAWLNFFMIVGYVQLLRILIALIAIIAGMINVKDFFFFKKGVSLTIAEGAKKKLIGRMRSLVHESALPGIIIGTIVLAFTANTFELLCTAGFPAIYTRVLTMQDLPASAYYGYLLLYNLIYVVPLAVIVGIFVGTMGAHRMTETQGRWLKLIGGAFMLVLGAMLLLAPEMLAFG